MRKLTTLALLFFAASVATAAEPVRIDAVRDARQPQLAVDPGGKVYLAFGAGDTVYWSASTDGGKSYTTPVKVGQAGVMALGMRRGPRVAATDKAVVVTAVCGERGKGRDGDLVAWRSADGGATWQGPATVNTVPGSAREGLHHMAAGPDGSVYCVWLDLRAKKTQVYGAASTDGGATWKSEGLIYQSPDGSVCECCQPSVAYDARGGLHVLWRNQLRGARDMYLTTSTDGGKTFRPEGKLGTGTWRLNSCPMDGGGLAADADGQLLTLWRRDKELYRCTPFKSEQPMGDGEQGWAAAGPGGFYVVYVKGRPGAIMAAVPGATLPMTLAERGDDPVVAAPLSGKGPVVVAWEEGRTGNQTIRAAIVAPGR